MTSMLDAVCYTPGNPAVHVGLAFAADFFAPVAPPFLVDMRLEMDSFALVTLLGSLLEVFRVNASPPAQF